MGVTRKWVFPILRLVIFGAIAIALVKIAFLDGAASPEQSGAVPTGQIEEPTVAAALGTIRNDVVLDGTVNADAPAAVKATLAGEVRELPVAAGQHVDAGAVLFTVRSETPGEPLADGSFGSPKVRTEKVTAPVSGTITELSVIKGQTVTVGEVAARIAPPTFNVTASLTPQEQYRLLTQPTEAQVTIAGGPAPFACTGLTITTGGAATDPGTTPDGMPTEGSSGTSVRCAVPADVRVFAGLTAEVTIPAGIAENVVVIPTTAVEGGAETGNVHLMLEDGSTEVRPVKLGLSDGSMVQVTEGLAEGEAVLQFVPGAPAPSPEEGMPGGFIVAG